MQIIIYTMHVSICLLVKYIRLYIDVGSITMNSARIKDGVQFSMPTYVTGLGAMIYAPLGTTPSRTFFTFFKPFTWQVIQKVIACGIMQ